MELAELLAELEAWVEIRQLEELEVFNSLRLSVVVAAEVLPEVLADVAVEVLAEILEVEASLVVYYLGSSVS